MTRAEAEAEQARISKNFNLGWWYGTGCEKCCGVYPRLRSTDDFADLCRYECDVCGKRTGKYSMPWLAAKAWNDGIYESAACQMTLF